MGQDRREEILAKFKQGQLSLPQLFDQLEESPAAEKQEQGIKTEELQQVEKELNQLIGLEKIKKIVAEIKAFVRIQKERKRRQLQAESVVLHMIFKGNPGTGKTTVARLLGRLFKALGVLETGDLKEVERADLVGEYVGHTAQKTKEAIEAAQGGVLFIDEAYSLSRGGKKDFGKEAIDTLVKALEAERQELIIILAGYPEEMDYFLQSNPGLKSRFPLQIEFEDYTLEQLVKIGCIMAERREYKLTAGGETKLYTILSQLRAEGGLDAGNARTVRNIIEGAVRKQALRLVNEEQLARQQLIKLTKSDLGEVNF